jgi:hypothetical protein
LEFVKSRLSELWKIVAAAVTRKRRVVVLVLGMHRSGTSALTRMLNLLGCDLPKTLIGAGRYNETGHWESLEICKLNDRILASADSNWSDWREFDSDWLNTPQADKIREEAAAVLDDEYGDSRLFVSKDPRNCRLVGFWSAVFNEMKIKPVIILTIRNPIEVAASLESRNGFDRALGHLLWLRHVLDAEHASRGMARIFTSYDKLMTDWREIAKQTKKKMRFLIPRPSREVARKIDTFLSPGLRHHREVVSNGGDDPQLSKWLHDTFAIFDGWTKTGESAADFDTLDRIRREFNANTVALWKIADSQRASAKRKPAP